MGRHKFKRGDRVIVNQENHGVIVRRLFTEKDDPIARYDILFEGGATSGPWLEDRIRFDTATKEGMNAYRHWRKREDRHWSERPKAARFYNWLTRKKGK